MSDLKYREAFHADIPHMKRIRDHVIENVLVSRKIEIKDYERALFKDGKGWVCVDREQIVGFSCGRLPQQDVWALFIEQEYEGLGIGSKLMELLESWMFANGCGEITLSTDPDTRAYRLYLRRGWRVVKSAAQGEVQLLLKRPES